MLRASIAIGRQIGMRHGQKGRTPHPPMKCLNGHILQNNQRYCTECGAPRAETVEPPTPAAQPVETVASAGGEPPTSNSANATPGVRRRRQRHTTVIVVCVAVLVGATIAATVDRLAAPHSRTSKPVQSRTSSRTMASPPTDPSRTSAPAVPALAALTPTSLHRVDPSEFWTESPDSDWAKPPVIPCGRYPVVGDLPIKRSTFVIGVSAPVYLRDFVVTFPTKEGASAYLAGVKDATASCHTFDSENQGPASVTSDTAPRISLVTPDARSTTVAPAAAYTITYATGPGRSVALAEVGSAVAVVVFDGGVLVSSSQVLNAMLPAPPVGGESLSPRAKADQCMSSLTAILTKVAAGAITQSQGEAQIPHAEARRLLLLAVQGASRYQAEGESQADAVLAASDAFANYCQAKYGLTVPEGVPG